MIANSRAKLLPIGVILGPGQTALTVIFLQAISLARVLLKEIIAPLVPEYTASFFVLASLVCQTANWGQQTGQSVLNVWRAQGLAKDVDISRMFPSDRRERIELDLKPLSKMITSPMD